MESVKDLSDGQIAILVLHFDDPNSVKTSNIPFWGEVKHLFEKEEQVTLFLKYANERLVNWW